MSDTTTAPESTQENAGEDVLPDWAREKLTKANNEAAKYRTEKNEAVEAFNKLQAQAAEFQTAKEKLEADLVEKEEAVKSSRQEVDRVKAAISAGIEGDKVFSFAELLKGETPEEFQSHAAELKKLFTPDEQPTNNSKATDPSQGAGSDKNIPLNGDPLLNAVMNVLK